MPAAESSLTRLSQRLVGHPPPSDLRDRFLLHNFLLAALLGLLACPLLGALFFALGGRGEVVPLGVGATAVLGVLADYRRRRHIERALNQLLGVYFLLICYYACVLGGVTSAAAGWLVIPPCVAVSCSMWRAAAGWCTAAVGTLLVLYGLEAAGYAFPTMAGAASPTLYLCGALLLAALLIGFLSLLGRSRERTLAYLARGNEELRVARDGALAASRAKAEFLANVSHEMRTPLNGVLGMAELIARLPLAEQQARLLATLRRSGEHLLRLIDDVLDYTTLEARSVTLVEVPFEPRELVAHLAESFMNAADAKGLALTVSVTDDVPRRVRGDAQRVRQVLFNLVSNAVKFTHQGHVRIEARVAPGHTREAPLIAFDVIDTGIGIDAERLAQIFKAFAQADTSSTRAFGGLGLGLTLSESLARLMGGTLQIESEPGGGTRASCVLRFAGSAEEEGQVSIEVPAKGQGPAGPTVLLVEDNPVNLELGVAMLEQLNCTVTVAQHGEEALARWQIGEFDVVLMDCHMPILDGYAATRRIRAEERARALPPVPIVAVTANVAKEDRDACFAAGMDDFLAKPYTLAQLNDVLVRHGPQSRAA